MHGMSDDLQNHCSLMFTGIRHLCHEMQRIRKIDQRRKRFVFHVIALVLMLSVTDGPHGGGGHAVQTDDGPRSRRAIGARTCARIQNEWTKHPRVSEPA
jgi:hypothetical protein